MTTKYKIRQGTAEDAPVLRELIESLASHLKEESVKYDVAYLRQCIKSSTCHALIAEDCKGLAVGFIMYYYAMDAISGKFIFMEAYFVKPECRNIGIGTALWSTLAQIAVDENHDQLEWQVHDWNVQALKLYQRMGGVDMRTKYGYLQYILNKQSIRKLAGLQSKICHVIKSNK